MAYFGNYGYANNNQIMNNPYQFNSNYQNIAQQTPINQINQDERIWVTGRNSAEAYLVAPNSFVRLWDSSAPVFYEKRSDNTGRPFPMEVYEYHKVNQNQQINPQLNVDYDKRINLLEERLKALEEGVKVNVPESNSNDATV